eukprot:XP_025015425.1 B3 domain-containing transcription factor VRN1 [Ricinus communis]
MASCSKQDNERLMFKTNRPHFFKVVLPQTIRERKLGIPAKFANRYGNDLPSSIILKVPSGAKWQVEIFKCDGDLWLQKGWQEFSKYYFIEYGSFLVFEFDQKNCGFNVFIFDKSASEIDYPLGKDNIEHNLEKESQEPNIQETENDDHSVEILGHYSPCRKTRQKSPLLIPSPRKKIKLENSTRTINPTFPTGQVEGGTDCEAHNGKGGISSEKQRLNRFFSRRKHLKNEAKADAIQRASANFESKNPYFMLVMHPSHVHPVHARATIPASFAREYLDKNHGNATLNGFNGRTWSIEYNIRMHPARSPCAEIIHGWKKFAEDNHLKVGDVCLFEIINNSKRTKTTAIVFKVAIFQGNNKKLTQGKRVRREHVEKPSYSALSGEVEAAEKFTSLHPFFKLVLTSSCVKGGGLNVPKNFIMDMKPRTYETNFQVKNRWWPVRLNIYLRHSRGKFSAGWILFARENSLQAGDVCIFELIDRETMLIKVSIFRRVKQLV